MACGGGTMDIQKITILGGTARDGSREPLASFELRMGDVASIVGPTGSGKTALINDIGMFANANTPTLRRVLINDEVPPASFREDPASNPIALITQHTSFLSDLPVQRFLGLHAKIRRSERPETIVEETLQFANQLTGEPIDVDSAMTELSGGQSRALLIADAVVIGNSPIILLDEIENAGIDRSRALALLGNYQKIFLFVTHDLHIALHSTYRLVMRGGAMQDLIVTAETESRMATRLDHLEKTMIHFRDRVRAGLPLSEDDLNTRLAQMPGVQP